MKARKLFWLVPLFGALAFAAQAQGQDAGNRLNLACDGSGAANKVRSGSAMAWDDAGNSAQVQTTQQSTVGFEDQLQLWIEGEEGKVRMPRTMLPIIHGGDGGWFDLKNIKVTANEITASVAINFMNKPKLILDRLSGTVSLAGKVGQFNGHCQKFDPDTVRRAF
jgi:hypothetical protein